MAENKVKFGLEMCHYAMETEDDVYGDVTALPGAVNMTLTPTGETSNFFADDQIYYASVANQGFELELELARLPEQFEQDALGVEIHENTGIMIESRNSTPKRFAFSFKILGDRYERLFWMYGCTASRPTTEAGTTTETIEPQTDTINVTAAGLSDEKGTTIIKTSEKTSEDVRKKWFEKVIMPSELDTLQTVAMKDKVQVNVQKGN